MDRSDDYKHITAALVEEAKKPADPTLASKNPFDAMDMKCEDFEQGVRRLGQTLNIANHPDHLKVITKTTLQHKCCQIFSHLKRIKKKTTILL